MPAVLVALTAADHWTLKDGTRHPTGFWAEELVAPMQVFLDAGVEVTIATPQGRQPVVDQNSLSPERAGGEEKVAELRKELDGLADQLQSPARLEDASPDDYDAVFVPGGHGPMEDLAVSPELGRLIVALADAGKVVAAVCHGPAGLLSATRADGTWAFAGREVTGFSNDEERQGGLADQAPWLLEDRLREAGGNVRTGPAWHPFSIVDGRLVTGQNPASSTETAQKTVDLLK